MSDEQEVSFIEEARIIASRCWCEKDTEKTDFDPILAEIVAEKIALWMDTAAQYHRNSEYYRGLLVKCGKYLAPESYQSDDGLYQEDVLCAKIPELVKKLTKQ